MERRIDLANTLANHFTTYVMIYHLLYCWSTGIVCWASKCNILYKGECNIWGAWLVNIWKNNDVGKALYNATVRVVSYTYPPSISCYNDIYWVKYNGLNYACDFWGVFRGGKATTTIGISMMV